MNNHIPTAEETAQAITAAKASPIFAAAYDAVFEHMRTTNRTEAIKAADRSFAATCVAAARDRIGVLAAVDAARYAYTAELARINKEYPQ
jgi:hypothetical protein